VVEKKRTTEVREEKVKHEDTKTQRNEPQRAQRNTEEGD
jgi:hypothetical protein